VLESKHSSVEKGSCCGAADRRNPVQLKNILN